MTKMSARTLASIGIALVVALACSISADAQDRVRWKLQSAFGSNLAHLGTAGVRFTKNIERVSGGNFEHQVLRAGRLGARARMLRCRVSGSVEVCWTTPGYHTGKIPALAFFTTVPFGPQYGEFFAWKIFGGGDELRTRSTASTTCTRSTASPSARRLRAGSASRSRSLE